MENIVSSDVHETMTAMSRRSLLNQLAICGLGVAAAPFLANVARAQALAGDAAPLTLPLRLTALLHHTGISVPDVLESATFYSKLFGGSNVQGEKEPFLRYFIQLNPGSVAIGKLGTLGSQGQTVPLIDHICVEAVPYDDAAWRARLKEEKLPYIASGVFLDADNIPIQVAGGEGGESLSAGAVSEMPVLYEGPPLVTTHGFHHVMLRVTDVDRSVGFWKKMFGINETERRDGIAWLSDGTVGLGLRKVSGQEQPGIDYQGVKTAPFDRRNVLSGLTSLKAKILTPQSYDSAASIRFVGLDGIHTLLVPD